MIVNYRGGVSDGDLGALHWFDLADTKTHATRTLRFAEVINIFIGKQTPVFMDASAAAVCPAFLLFATWHRCVCQ